MFNDFKEAEAILEMIQDAEGEQDALETLQTAGYSADDAEALLEAGLELLSTVSDSE